MTGHVRTQTEPRQDHFLKVRGCPGVQARFCGALFVVLHFVDAVLRMNNFLNCGAQVAEDEFCYAST